MLIKLIKTIYKKHKIRMQPNSHIKSVGNHSQSIGDNPRFVCQLPQPQPHGWVMVSYRTQKQENWLIPNPILFMDLGRGIEEGEVINLRQGLGPIITDVLYMPKTVKNLVIRPVNENGDFVFSDFEIYPIPKWMALLWAIGREFQSGFRAATLTRKVLKALGLMTSSKGRSKLRTMVRLRLASSLRHGNNDDLYDQWIRKQIKTIQGQKGELSKQVEQFKLLPQFSIVVPCYNVKEKWLRKAVDSVINQIYPHWELCLADDCSTDIHVREILKEYESHPQIKVTFREKNGGISAATNSALELATGDFMCLMDNDDEIPPHALLEFAKRLNEQPQLDMIYSDEDKISEEGRHYEPFFKPDWSPDYLEEVMYTAHFACYRMSIVRDIKGFRSDFDGAQDYDFVLRFTEKTDRVGHIHKVLYHWRAIRGSTAFEITEKDYVLQSAVKAVKERLDRTGRKGEVKVGPYCGCFNARIHLDQKPLVSIIIPSAGRTVEVAGRKIDLLANCIQSIVNKSTYDNYEIVVVDNGDLSESTKKSIKDHVSVFCTYTRKQVNIAAKINMGAKRASGEYFLILNDDVEPMSDDWIEAMLEQATKPDVGVVGAKLLYENELLQHVGVTFCDGLPDHVRKKFPREDPGYFFSTVATRNWLAVTGACMLTPKSIFQKVGGYSESLPINYNDIDFCLKVYTLKKRIVYTPHAELYHFESLSREPFVPDGEIRRFLSTWGEVTRTDPYYNENMLVSRPPNFASRLPIKDL